MATAKKRPSSHEIKAMLQEGSFSTSSELSPADPITTVQLVLTLDEIKPYDRNPRREINPAYDEIKASIRQQRGLNNHFNVTRRPGDDKYMIESGGNTRLKILQELLDETGDDAFNQVHCLFVPWQSEAHLLSAHLIENELRGDITLIDKAYAIQELKHQLEQQQDKPLSQRSFMKAAEALGYRLSGRHARRLAYALELDQLIPETLRAGLGGHKLDEIKNIEKAYHRFCTGKTEQLPALFAHIMTEHDDPDWHLEPVRRELDTRLSELIAIPVQNIRREVDALLFNETSTDTDLSGTAQKQDNRLPRGPHESPFTHSNTVEDHPADASDEVNGTSRNPNRKNKSHADSEDQPKSADGLMSSPFSKKAPLPAEHDLASLRNHCCMLAKRIASTVHLESMIAPATSGYGYVIDAPNEPLDNPGTWGIWWLLFGISEQSVSEQRLGSWQHTRLYLLFSADDEAQHQQMKTTQENILTFMFTDSVM